MKRAVITEFIRLAYKDKMLASNGDPEHPIVKVFSVGRFVEPLFVTTSLDEAMRWVDGEWCEEKCDE